MYAPVTRGGVHKRLKEGKLTAFNFHITEHTETLFGRTKIKKDRPIVLIPSPECKAWGAELKKRVENIEKSKNPDSVEIEREINEVNAYRANEEEDRNQEFLEYDPADKGNKSIEYNVTLPVSEFLALLAHVPMMELERLFPRWADRKRMKEFKRRWLEDHKDERGGK